MTYEDRKQELLRRALTRRIVRKFYNGPVAKLSDQFVRRAFNAYLARVLHAASESIGDKKTITLDSINKAVEEEKKTRRDVQAFFTHQESGQSGERVPSDTELPASS